MLLRHSLPPVATLNGSDSPTNQPICVTVHKDVVREHIGNKDFEFNAGM